MFYLVLDRIISPLTKVRNYRGMDQAGGYFNRLDSDNKCLVDKVSQACEYDESNREDEVIEKDKNLLYGIFKIYLYKMEQSIIYS